MNSMMSLFFSQSYRDAWDDYIRALNNQNFARWDYVILTASNEHQAEIFRAQIQERMDEGFLPRQTCFAVLPDPDGKRVGSGGATLNVIRHVMEQLGGVDFSRKRILVIHSGGDSRRVPQYSALGKLFSAVPRELPNGRASTLFDEFMIGMSGVPRRMRDGMLLLSGDVLLLFNPLQIDFPGTDAAAISFKEYVETGKNHGVYLMGEDGNVAEFLHKQSVETLTRKGAVNERGRVDIDTGAVFFSADMLRALCGLFCEGGAFSPEKYAELVNEKTRLSLYGDFLYPLASRSTLEDFYREKPEGEFCEELTSARTKVWHALRPFRMKLLRLSPAKFVHFGTTREIMHLLFEEIDNYASLSWNRQVCSSVKSAPFAAYQSVVSDPDRVGANSYIEASYVHSAGQVGNNVVLSYVDIHDEVVPDNVVLHGLKQMDGRFVVRIYGVDDNPKDELEKNGCFLGGTIREFLDKNGIAEEELWPQGEHSMWTAQLYPTGETIQEAVGHALNVYAMARGEGDVECWRKSCRKSLCAGFNDADAQALLDWVFHMRDLVKICRVEDKIHAGYSVDDVASLLQGSKLTKVQYEWLERHVARDGAQKALRLYYYIGSAIGGAEGARLISRCFETIRDSIMRDAMLQIRHNDNCRIVMDEHIVRLPLRVNWGGGWSDTPPYCNENGGTVINAAISLGGEYPVSTILRRLEEKKIVLVSRDIGAEGEFTDIRELQNCSDPYDPFALQKAVLMASGIIPLSGGDLQDILSRMGGGIYMECEVRNVPKGSGLGTSSILAGCCMKALYEFADIPHSQDDLYNSVLCMEQVMTTGGGWQDQVGGLTPGVKYITSKPGSLQRMKVQPVEMEAEVFDELNQRFALIYTGQRRLARNLLRKVVGRYVGNVSEAVSALDDIQRIAALMRFELERGNVDGFAQLLNRHWELSKQLDNGCTNTCIEQIFHAVQDLIDGRMVCGAGGGGFVQVILKKGVTRDELRNRLHDVFQDNGVDVWDCSLIQ